MICIVNKKKETNKRFFIYDFLFCFKFPFNLSITLYVLFSYYLTDEYINIYDRINFVVSYGEAIKQNINAKSMLNTFSWRMKKKKTTVTMSNRNSSNAKKSLP